MVSTSLPPAVIPDELAPAFDRFRHRVDRLTATLLVGLHDIHEAHGLSYNELVRTQRALRRLESETRAPSAQSFWDSTAYPRAQMLVTAAQPLIDVAGHTFSDAVSRLSRSVELATVDHQSISPIAPGLLRRMIDVGGNVVCTATPSRDEIDQIGERWHRRLRRAAWKSVVPTQLAMSTTALEDRIDRMELELLEQLPWAHGDRLLSAFELAHVDIKTMIRTASRASTSDPVDRELSALQL